MIKVKKKGNKASVIILPWKREDFFDFISISDSFLKIPNNPFKSYNGGIALSIKSGGEAPPQNIMAKKVSLGGLGIAGGKTTVQALLWTNR
jgi:hypothetical protein